MLLLKAQRSGWGERRFISRKRSGDRERVSASTRCTLELMRNLPMHLDSMIKEDSGLFQVGPGTNLVLKANVWNQDGHLWITVNTPTQT